MNSDTWTCKCGNINPSSVPDCPVPGCDGRNTYGLSAEEIAAYDAWIAAKRAAGTIGGVGSLRDFANSTAARLEARAFYQNVRAPLVDKIAELEAKNRELEAALGVAVREGTEALKDAHDTITLYRYAAGQLLDSHWYDPESCQVRKSDGKADMADPIIVDSCVIEALRQQWLELKMTTDIATCSGRTDKWRQLALDVLDLNKDENWPLGPRAAPDDELIARLRARYDEACDMLSKREQDIKAWRTWGETVAALLPGEEKIVSPDLRLRITREYQARLKLGAEWRHWAEKLAHQISPQMGMCSNSSEELRTAISVACEQPIVLRAEIRAWVNWAQKQDLGCQTDTADTMRAILSERLKGAGEAQMWWSMVYSIVNRQGHQPQDHTHARKYLEACVACWEAESKALVLWKEWATKHCPTIGVDSERRAALDCRLSKAEAWRKSAMDWQDWAAKLLGLTGVQVDQFSRTNIDQRLKDLVENNGRWLSWASQWIRRLQPQRMPPLSDADRRSVLDAALENATDWFKWSCDMLNRLGRCALPDARENRAKLTHELERWRCMYKPMSVGFEQVSIDEMASITPEQWASVKFAGINRTSDHLNDAARFTTYEHLMRAREGLRKSEKLRATALGYLQGRLNRGRYINWQYVLNLLQGLERS